MSFLRYHEKLLKFCHKNGGSKFWGTWEHVYVTPKLRNFVNRTNTWTWDSTLFRKELVIIEDFQISFIVFSISTETQQEEKFEVKCKFYSNYFKIAMFGVNWKNYKFHTRIIKCYQMLTRKNFKIPSKLFQNGNTIQLSILKLMQIAQWNIFHPPITLKLLQDAVLMK